MIRFNQWRNHSKEEIMSQVYWLRDQLPPSDPEEYEKAWETIRKELTEKFGD